jgi:hypothetical protein
MAFMPSSTISLGLILVNFCVRCSCSRFFLSIADHIIIYNLCQKLFTIQAAFDTPYFHQSNHQSIKSIPCESAIHVTVIALLQLHKFLFYPSFISQIRENSHESIIVDIDVIQNDRMVNLAKFLDEFLYRMLFSLIFSV